MMVVVGVRRMTGVTRYLDVQSVLGFNQLGLYDAL